MGKFSILIAHYNNGEYFADCYNSLISQTYDNWEAIIVDDASTDNSLKIIQKIIDNDIRFKLYKNHTNEGCGATKRKCIKYAIGEICAFLDPDDALHPSALEKSVHRYNTNRDIVATYSKMMMCDEGLNPQQTFNLAKQIYNNPYFFNCPIQIAHFFTFKKEVYLKTQGINPDLKRAVDQDLYLKILEHGNPSFIQETLYYYRLHTRGISQQQSKQKAKESFARIIFTAMIRRNIKMINGEQVPDIYKNSEEIYSLLTYQQKFTYKLKVRFKLFLRELIKR